MGIGRSDRNISKSLAYDARHGDNRDRIVKGAVSDDFANTAEKKVRQAKKFNKGMVKRRKQLKAVANEPDEPKKKVDDLSPTPDDMMRAKSPFEKGSGRFMNRGRKPVDPESEN
jgi:hypothetical protein